MTDAIDTTQLENRANSLHGRYQSRFAGYSRITRDIKEMDNLIEETREFLGSLDTPELAYLREQTTERLELYENERKAINEAQSAGEDAIIAGTLGMRANFAMARYRRNFSGKARKTRDLGLLAEIVEDLKKIQASMKEIAARYDGGTLKDDLGIVERSLELYVRERGEIVAARNMQLIDQKAEMLAEMANNQFALYRVHFAGKSRLSRRPGLLQRMINNLDLIRNEMQSHKSAGLRSSANDRNIRIVVDHLKLYRREIREIKKSRSEASAEQLIDALANAANALMGEYRENFAGQNRATRNLDLLSGICDRMGELERQMTNIERKTQNTTNHRNLNIVRDMLTLYDREYTEIQKAK